MDDYEWKRKVYELKNRVWTVNRSSQDHLLSGGRSVHFRQTVNF